MSSHVDFRQVTLLKIVRKYLLRPEYFILGLNSIDRARKCSWRHAPYKGVSWRSTLSATIPSNPGVPSPDESRGSAARRRWHLHYRGPARTADRTRTIPFSDPIS